MLSNVHRNLFACLLLLPGIYTTACWFIFGDEDQGITTSGILWNMVCSEISRSFVYHKEKNNSESCYFITIQISKQYIVSNRGGSSVSSQEADRIAQPVKEKNKRIISTKHKVISTKSSVNVF